MSRLAVCLAQAAGALLSHAARLLRPPAPPPYDVPLCPGCGTSLAHPLMPATGTCVLACFRCGTRTRWDVTGELPIMLSRV